MTHTSIFDDATAAAGSPDSGLELESTFTNIAQELIEIDLWLTLSLQSEIENSAPHRHTHPNIGQRDGSGRITELRA